MSETLINIIVQIVAGAIGGNGAGAALKDVNLGTLGNTIAGAIGGVAGGQLLSALIPAWPVPLVRPILVPWSAKRLAVAFQVPLSRPLSGSLRARWQPGREPPGDAGRSNDFFR